MISRNRSAPTAVAMSIECTTSANNTVTCLYSAGRATDDAAVPHSLQNLAVGGVSVPQAVHATGRMVSSLASLRGHISPVTCGIARDARSGTSPTWFTELYTWPTGRW